VPVPASVAAVARHLDLDPLGLVFGDSVDFELTFTAPSGAVDQLRNEIGLHVIGEVTDDTDVVLCRSDGGRTPLPGKAWKHTVDEGGG
jgi:thiamine-monophosphate kinase